jgi:hypothetical protein
MPINMFLIKLETDTLVGELIEQPGKHLAPDF